eukprot:1095169-Prymnesium_polylepis.2
MQRMTYDTLAPSARSPPSPLPPYIFRLKTKPRMAWVLTPYRAGFGRTFREKAFREHARSFR